MTDKAARNQVSVAHGLGRWGRIRKFLLEPHVTSGCTMPASSCRCEELAMPERLWKVGELAARTGLTVRTLHHYDTIGLLSPSGRTGSEHGSGHRLYTAADVACLHQIICLKQLGFSLDQVKEYMTGADYDPREVVRLHLVKVRQQAVELAELGNRLEALATALDAADTVS